MRPPGDGRYEEVSPTLARVSGELAELGISARQALEVAGSLRRHADSVARALHEAVRGGRRKPFEAEGRPEERWTEVSRPSSACARSRPSPCTPCSGWPWTTPRSARSGASWSACRTRRSGNALHRSVYLRFMADVSTCEISLHGQPVTYRTAAATGRCCAAPRHHQLLGEPGSPCRRGARGATSRIIAPDLLGHGQSDKPRGDYSLGAHASGVRDLLLALGHERGDGRRALARRRHRDAVRLPVPGARRAAGARLQRRARPRGPPCCCAPSTLPGADWVLPLTSAAPACSARGAASSRRSAGSGSSRPDIDGLARGFASLDDRGARRAFLHTVRSVIDTGGQRVERPRPALPRRRLPTLIVWGEQRPDHPGRPRPPRARAMPGSRLELFEHAGHFPHLDDPLRFTRVLREFLCLTEPAERAAERARALMLARAA